MDLHLHLSDNQLLRTMSKINKEDSNCNQKDNNMTEKGRLTREKFIVATAAAGALGALAVGANTVSGSHGDSQGTPASRETTTSTTTYREAITAVDKYDHQIESSDKYHDYINTSQVAANPIDFVGNKGEVTSYDPRMLDAAQHASDVGDLETARVLLKNTALEGGFSFADTNNPLVQLTNEISDKHGELAIKYAEAGDLEAADYHRSFLGESSGTVVPDINHNGKLDGGDNNTTRNEVDAAVEQLALDTVRREVANGNLVAAEEALSRMNSAVYTNADSDNDGKHDNNVLFTEAVALVNSLKEKAGQ